MNNRNSSALRRNLCLRKIRAWARCRVILMVMLASVSAVYAAPVYQTIQVIPHVASDSLWETLLETMNASAGEVTYYLCAYNDSGIEIASQKVTVPGFGLLHSRVRDLFGDVSGNIKTIRIQTEEDLRGKLYTAQRFMFHNQDEQAGVMIGLPEARARLSVPHITEREPWWTGNALINIGNEAVNVFFKDADGKYDLVCENMLPGQEYAFLYRDLAGEHRTGSGDLFAFSTDAHLDEQGQVVGGHLVNALAGEVVYGMRPTEQFEEVGYGFSESYQLRGQIVNDTGQMIAHNFAARDYIPLEQIPAMRDLYRDTGEWDGFAYRNVTDHDQLLRVRHYDRDGQLCYLNGSKEIVLKIAAGSRLASVPGDIGVETGRGGFVVLDVVDSEGNTVNDIGDALYLNGDLEDNHGRSVLGGGDVPTNLMQSRYLCVPVSFDAHNSALISLFNPTDEEVHFAFSAENAAGNEETVGTGELTLPAKGTYQTDLSSGFFPVSDSFNGIVLVKADNGTLVGVVNRYTITDNKKTTNADGLVLAPCNDPYGRYMLENLELNGETADSLEAPAGTENTIVVDYHTLAGENRVREIRLYVDGKAEKTYTPTNPAFSGQADFVYTFDTPGSHTLDIRLFADDCNDIPDAHLEKTVTASNTVKQAITGLVAMGNPVGALNYEDPLKEVKIHPAVYSGVVINAVWMYLEPQKGAYDFSTIDNALDEIAEYNRQYPEHPISAKLRIFGGAVAPSYVKELGGGPVTVQPSRGPSVEIGLFWTDVYGDRFAALLAQLALRYDDNKLLREVCVSTAASLTAEPFIAPLNRESNAALRERGFTDALYKQAIRRALDDYKVWKLTAIDFPFNVFNCTDNGWFLDVEFTTNLMRDFRAQYGERAVISNHGLIDPLTEGDALIYPTLQELGAPIAFQTRGPEVDFDSTIKLGFEYGMTEFEVWETIEAGGWADISYDTLKKWASLFPADQK
ncbi:MAG: hypothetical protein GXO70_00185 [Acidobacteria bacterium]|nr:hypothetical protein [Acidobacteriota bacterium]